MKSSRWWLIRRLAGVVVGAVSFSQILVVQTNFGVLAGLICAPLCFLLALSAVRKAPAGIEQVVALDSPCWPPKRYPRAYWSTAGGIWLVSSLANLMAHYGDAIAVHLYAGLSLVGLGLFAGATVGSHRVARTPG